MNVAYLAVHSSPLDPPGFGDAGGMNVYIDELARTMAARGVGSVVFTRRTATNLPEVVEPTPGYRVVQVAAGPPVALSVDELSPHLVEFAEGVLAWTRRHRVDFDVIHSHYWLSGSAGALLKDALGLPMVISFHTLGRVKDATQPFGVQPSTKDRLRTEHGVVAIADCVVAATPYEFADLVERYDANPERLRVSPPGVDHGLFSPGSRHRARSILGIGAEPLVLFVGRIQAYKGIDIAIRMLAQMPAAVATGEGSPRLLVVGGPSGHHGLDEEEHLHRLAADLGLGHRVGFVPPQPHREVAAYYRAADVLVMPSRTESFGLVAVEAQACGLPVVATRVGGLAYTVADSESGLLVDGHEPRPFAAAVTAVLDHPEFRARLSAGAGEYARRFSWEAAAGRFIELYDDIGRGR